jgi:hypothetical protein
MTELSRKLTTVTDKKPKKSNVVKPKSSAATPKKNKRSSPAKRTSKKVRGGARGDEYDVRVEKAIDIFGLEDLLDDIKDGDIDIDDFNYDDLKSYMRSSLENYVNKFINNEITDDQYDQDDQDDQNNAITTHNSVNSVKKSTRSKRSQP